MSTSTCAPAMTFPDSPTVPRYLPPASIRRLYEEAAIAERIEAIEKSERSALVRGVRAMLAAIW